MWNAFFLKYKKNHQSSLGIANKKIDTLETECTSCPFYLVNTVRKINSSPFNKNSAET